MKSRNPGPRRSQDARQSARSSAEVATRARTPLHTLTGVQVLATGACAPARVVRNEDLAEWGYDADWIQQRTGIRERRWAAADEATSDLAYRAAVDCLEQADVDPRDIDLIVLGTMTPDTPMPSAACHLQRRLGAVAPAMDVNAACAGFIYALVTGMQFVHSGAARRVLVVGADVMSRTVNPDDKKTFPLFGDAAGAVLLAPSKSDQGLLSYALAADGCGTDILTVPAGGSGEPLSTASIDAGRHFMHMDGRAVFKWAVRMLADSVDQALEHAQIAPDELDLVVLHQANVRIIDAAAEALNLPRDRVFVNLDRYGNTSAGSMPLALDEAHRAGRLHRGDHVLLCGFGAGLAWGTAVMKW